MKLVKNKYYTSDGKAKINNYMLAISKSIINEAGFNGDENIKVYAKDGKIIVEKEN